MKGFKSVFSLIKVLSIITLLVSGILYADSIKIGMSTALSGPAKALGEGVRVGVESYFSRINAEGGINGRKLELIVLDDGYEPKRAAPNMRRLINDEKVLAVIGNVGTPTAITTVPIANETKTLLFGAFTGAGILRKNPPDRYVINFRASYAEETAVMIKGLLDAGIKANEIVFFTQNDGYGDAGYYGALKALRGLGYVDEKKIIHGRYERNTLNVEDALATIIDSRIEPKAIIMVGAYAPCAKFIKLAKKDFPKALFLNVSFVGSRALATALGKNMDKVIVTQVVPHYNSKLNGVIQYRKDMAAYNSSVNPDFISLEGYLIAKIFVAGLKKSTNEPLNRETLIDGLEQLNRYCAGIGTPITYNENEHQASHTVWPTTLQNGKFLPFKWISLQTKGKL